MALRFKLGFLFHWRRFAACFGALSNARSKSAEGEGGETGKSVARRLVRNLTHRHPLAHDYDMTMQTLLDIENRRPFQPYSLRLNGGDVVRVEKSEHCLITEDGRTLVFNESDGKLKFISIVTVQLDLPDSVAAEAKAKGLLDPKRVAGLIARELSSETDQRSFFELVREIRAQPGDPMTMHEIQAEVDAVRAERRAREVGR